MKVVLPTLYSQWDPRWSQDKIGSDVGQNDNLYNYGCIITCLAMVCKYYGKDEDPGTLNKKLKDAGAFTNSDLYTPGGLTKIYKVIKEDRTATPSLLTDAQVGQIRSSLDAGFPVIIGIDYNPKTVEYDSHFVLVVDYNPADENDLTIADPLGGKLHSLKDYLGWFKPNSRNTIESYSIFSGSVPTQSNGLPPNYPDIIYKSTQWDIVCGSLNLGKPESTPAGSVDTVIAGYKSRQTDLTNKLNDAGKDLAQANQEIANREEQVSRLKVQVTEADQRTLEAQNALSKVQGDMEAMRKDLQGKIDGLFKDKGQLQNDLAACQAGKKLSLWDLIWKIIRR